MKALLLLTLVVALLSSPRLEAQRLERVVISADRSHFVLKNSGAEFRPWGFNYLGEFGTIMEEYWAEKWDDIEEDFREMKALGSNVIRVHLQFATYMDTADKAKPDELARLKRLLDLAQANGLYLDVTGLGCYHPAKTPKWYDGLSESDRWDAQARFWQVIAETCKGHPAVFCYSLMNEPVITEAKPGEHPWLTGEMEGFYFVQRIANKPGKRAQQEIAAAWVKQLTQAIRAVDPDHLITVGVIPWAMIWPNAKPIFYAPEAAKHLDFVSVHFYPQVGKVKEAVAALKVYDIGKPMVVEETFPLSCSQPEFEQFLHDGRPIVEGWISHYFGKNIADYAKEKDLRSAVMKSFLEFWQKEAPITSPAP